MATNQSGSIECPFVKQATEAFLVFDVSGNETVDVREVGTIVRSLGNLFAYSRRLNNRERVLFRMLSIRIRASSFGERDGR